MKWLARKFEESVERFLSSNLERHTKILSLTVLVLLAVCITAGVLLMDYRVTVKNPATGQMISKPLIGLLLGSGNKE
jgi:hypothetical protein